MPISRTVTRMSASSTPSTGSVSSPSRNGFMPQQLIKDRAIIEDRWTLVRDAGAADSASSSGPVIVPLSAWKSRREELAVHGDIGVWLAPNEDPAELVGEIATLPLIA